MLQLSLKILHISNISGIKCGEERVSGAQTLTPAPQRTQSDVAWSSMINNPGGPFYRVSQFRFHKHLPPFPPHLSLLIFLRYLSLNSFDSESSSSRGEALPAWLPFISPQPWRHPPPPPHLPKLLSPPHPPPGRRCFFVSCSSEVIITGTERSHWLLCNVAAARGLWELLLVL